MTIITNNTPNVPSFDALYAKMLPHFQYFAKRHIRRKGRRGDFNDVIQELSGFALQMYNSLIRRGKGADVFYTPLMKFAIKRYREGRRFATGSNTKDILADQTQILGKSDTCQLSQFDEEQDTWDFMTDRKGRVVDAVQFKIDYEAWHTSLSPRDQSIVTDLSYGYSTNEVSRKYGVSAGRISQYRKRYYKDWNDFIADPA